MDRRGGGHEEGDEGSQTQSQTHVIVDAHRVSSQSLIELQCRVYRPTIGVEKGSAIISSPSGSNQAIQCCQECGNLSQPRDHPMRPDIATRRGCQRGLARGVGI